MVASKEEKKRWGERNENGESAAEIERWVEKDHDGSVERVRGEVENKDPQARRRQRRKNWQR